MNKEKLVVKVARHIPSGCLLINGQWVIDYTDEDIMTGGHDDYENHVEGLIGEGEEGYDADNYEQEHHDDYEIVEYEFDLEYTDEQLEEYETAKERHEENRDNYYGYCMNGGGGRREFSKMYGNGDFMSFAEWLNEN